MSKTAAEEELTRLVLAGMVGGLSDDVRVVAFAGELVDGTMLEDHWPVEPYLGGGRFDVQRSRVRVLEPLIGGVAPGALVEVFDLAKGCGGTSLGCEEAIGAAEMRSAKRGWFVLGYRPQDESHPASGQAFTVRFFGEVESGHVQVQSRTRSVTVPRERLGKVIRRVWFANELDGR